MPHEVGGTSTGTVLVADKIVTVVQGNSALTTYLSATDSGVIIGNDLVGLLTAPT